jgi:hypothetical protein
MMHIMWNKFPNVSLVLALVELTNPNLVAPRGQSRSLFLHKL